MKCQINANFIITFLHKGCLAYSTPKNTLIVCEPSVRRGDAHINIIANDTQTVRPLIEIVIRAAGSTLDDDGSRARPGCLGADL